MTTESTIKEYKRLDSTLVNPSFNHFLSLLRRTLVASFLMISIWLPGLFLSPASAAPNTIAAVSVEVASQNVASAVAQGDRTSALITCLPKQLSQPSLKRALSEMGNDQIERAFNLKANPKLSQAETDLVNCLNRQGL